jgi:hypothetical protein
VPENAVQDEDQGIPAVPSPEENSERPSLRRRSSRFGWLRRLNPERKKTLDGIPGPGDGTVRSFERVEWHVTDVSGPKL